MTALLLAGLVLLSGCGGAEPKNTETPPVTEPPAPTAMPEPAWTPATVRADDTGALYTLLNRGDEVTVTGESGAYYVLNVDGLTLYAEACFIRTEEPETVTWEGWAQRETAIYATAYLTGEPLKTIVTNTKITVLDTLGDIAYVKVGKTEGYIRTAAVGLERAEVEESRGGTSPDASPGGEAGAGGLSAAARGHVECLAAGTERTGTVFTDGLEVYARVFSRDEGVQLVETEGAVSIILTDGLICTVPTMLLATWTQTERTAYAGMGAVLYENLRLSRAAAVLPENCAVTVLEDFDGVAFVRVNGSTGFMAASALSDTEWQTAHNGGTEETGDTGGSSADGVWTDPVL